MNALNAQEKERIFDLCTQITQIVETAQMRLPCDDSSGSWLALINIIGRIDDLYQAAHDIE